MRPDASVTVVNQSLQPPTKVQLHGTFSLRLSDGYAWTVTDASGQTCTISFDDEWVRAKDDWQSLPFAFVRDGAIDLAQIRTILGLKEKDAVSGELTFYASSTQRTLQACPERGGKVMHIPDALKVDTSRGRDALLLKGDKKCLRIARFGVDERAFVVRYGKFEQSIPVTKATISVSKFENLDASDAPMSCAFLEREGGEELRSMPCGQEPTHPFSLSGPSVATVVLDTHFYKVRLRGELNDGCPETYAATSPNPLSLVGGKLALALALTLALTLALRALSSCIVLAELGHFASRSTAMPAAAETRTAVAPAAASVRARASAAGAGAVALSHIDLGTWQTRVGKLHGSALRVSAHVPLIYGALVLKMPCACPWGRCPCRSRCSPRARTMTTIR